MIYHELTLWRDRPPCVLWLRAEAGWDLRAVRGSARGSTRLLLREWHGVPFVPNVLRSMCHYCSPLQPRFDASMCYASRAKDRLPLRYEFAVTRPLVKASAVFSYRDAV